MDPPDAENLPNPLSEWGAFLPDWLRNVFPIQPVVGSISSAVKLFPGLDYFSMCFVRRTGRVGVCGK